MVNMNGLVENTRKTDNFFIKWAITVLCSNQFFNAVFSTANKSRTPYTGMSTISFDCDQIHDIVAIPTLLDQLSSYDFKVSFACIGKQIERHPKEHSLIVDHGHEIVNHTYTHPFNDEIGSTKRFDRMLRRDMIEEISKCHEVCKTILNYEPVGFRIPHFGVQYTEAIYSVLSELNYKFSSSILAIRNDTHANPCMIDGILEFPIMSCPVHPFHGYDTYHAFRSKLTSHKDESNFYSSFTKLIEYCATNNMYVNFLFDPQDVAKFANFNQFLEYLNSKTKIKNYFTIVNSISGDNENIADNHD